MCEMVPVRPVFTDLVKTKWGKVHEMLDIIPAVLQALRSYYLLLLVITIYYASVLLVLKHHRMWPNIM